MTEQAIGRDEIAFISWSLSEALGEILGQIPTPRTKALPRLLIEEIRVVSSTDIRPTYRVPRAPVSPAAWEGEDAVREQKGMEDKAGLERGPCYDFWPTRTSLCARRRCHP